MLAARQVPRACQSCRLQLLSLFENGFTRSPSPRASLKLRNRQQIGLASSPRSHSIQRPFSTRGSLRDHRLDATDAGDAARDAEEVVRQARQTFGETLPSDYLTAEEYVLYERLYGPPLRETRAEDLEFFGAKEELDEAETRAKNGLLRENVDGDFEEVDFEPGMLRHRHIEEEQDLLADDLVDLQKHEDLEAPSEYQDDEGAVQVQAKSQREVDAILRLQRDVAAFPDRPVEEDEEDINEEVEEESEEIDEEEIQEDEDPFETIRTHPHTVAARFGTHPSTLQLPQEPFVLPITELLTRVNAKHLTTAAEKAFGGPGLPFSSATPASKKLLPQRYIGLEAGQHKMSEVEADAYMAGVMPGVYAATMSTLVETRKRLGSSWIRDLLFRKGGNGPRVLDAGAGGAGIVAWREVLQAEWDVLRSEGLVKGEQAPFGKSTVLTGPLTLRDRVSRILENTTFLPRLPDYVHSSRGERMIDGAPNEGRKTFDVIIAPHTLFPLKEDYRRKTQVQNLWSLLDPNGGVLILIEKGLPRGFEAIAGARSLLLHDYISSPGKASHIENELQSPEKNGQRFREKEKGMIIAPCTNHTTCPMYRVEGISSGRKDFCHFGQRFLRPPYLQRLLGAKGRNHEDVKFSYLAVRRGVDKRSADKIVQGEEATLAAFEGHEDQDVHTDGDADADTSMPGPSFSPLSLPRAVLSPLKRRGHVTMDLCTPSGTLERWTVPKSFSTQAYRDARKSKWGDLWALGAKTRTVREVRLGREHSGKDEKKIKAKGGRMGGIRRPGEGEMLRKRRNGKGRDVFEVEVGDTGMEGIRHLTEGKIDRNERRTKGGRREGRKKEIKEDDY
ncbi:MAG: 37S ribosomal protein S22 [Claussenomyces sp. TS43310]|nr:MAG: 37S ribosomal protein S22 [Claussenomyces sp. TS43310]